MNPRPPAPKAGALPRCATPRKIARPPAPYASPGRKSLLLKRSASCGCSGADVANQSIIIGAGADDARENSVGGVALVETSFAIRNDTAGSSAVVMGLHFPNVNIAQGATVSAADLRLWATNTKVARRRHHHRAGRRAGPRLAAAHTPTATAGQARAGRESRPARRLAPFRRAGHRERHERARPGVGNTVQAQ